MVFEKKKRVRQINVFHFINWQKQNTKMEGIDLSVPFRRAVQIQGVVSTAIVEASSSGSTSKIIIAVGLVLFIAYFFFGPAASPKPQTIAGPQTPAPNALKLADAAFEHGNIQSQYHFALENYTEALNTNNTPESVGHICHRLATLFHQGCPDSAEGSGVPPNAEEAIHFYREAIKNGYHGAILPLASIYHWGLTKFEGNREVAKHLYGVVLKTGTEYEKGLAKDRLRQMREETGQSVGTGMLDEEASVANNFGTNTFGANPYSENFMDLDRSPYSIGKDETTRDIDEKYVDDLIQNKLGIDTKNRKESLSGKKITSDPQNARDHVVVNSAKQSLERLRANTHIQYDIPTTFKMIHEYIVKKSDVARGKRELATQVLRELSKGITNLGYEQSKEIEALHLVWNRIHSQVYAQDTEKRKCLTENLVNELAECIEYGELVCPTGRLNRIIDSLNHQDPIVNIQPKWAVQQSMVARAGVIQKSLLSKSQPDVRDAMEARNPSARQRQLQEEFTQKVRAAIERDLIRQYVDTGMMSKELLKTELDAWIL